MLQHQPPGTAVAELVLELREQQYDGVDAPPHVSPGRFLTWSMGSKRHLSPGLGTATGWVTPPILKWLRCPQHSSQWGCSRERTGMYAVFSAVRRRSLLPGSREGLRPALASMHRSRRRRIRLPGTVP